MTITNIPSQGGDVSNFTPAGVQLWRLCLAIHWNIYSTATCNSDDHEYATTTTSQNIWFRINTHHRLPTQNPANYQKHCLRTNLKEHSGSGLVWFWDHHDWTVQCIVMTRALMVVPTDRSISTSYHKTTATLLASDYPCNSLPNEETAHLSKSSFSIQNMDGTSADSVVTARSAHEPILWAEKRQRCTCDLKTVTTELGWHMNKTDGDSFSIDQFSKVVVEGRPT